MITPSFALTATERVLPKLALDFTTASLDPRVTFTRSGATATVVNSSGVIQGVAANTPRFDYNPTTLICKGLLIEEARTNLLLYSNDFSNAAYTKSRASIAAAGITAPDGTTNSWKLIEDTTASNTHRMFQGLTFAATANTVSIFAKKAERDFIYFTLTDSGGTGRTGYFNLSNGTLGTVPTNMTMTITDFGGGWYRCTATVTTAAGANNWLVGLANANNGAAYSGDGTSGVYVFGGGFEAGAFATSYIPTTTTALTRNADVATMTGTNFSDWFNASEGTFVARAASLTTSAATRSVFDVRSAATIRMSLTNFGTSASFAVVDTTTQASLDGTSAVVANTFFQVAGGYKVNNFGCAANGGATATDTSGTVPVANVAWIGGVNGTSVRNGWISNIRYYPQKLTSAEISAFSKQG